MTKHDASNGYDDVAEQFAAVRDQSSTSIDVVRAWAQNLANEAAVLDLGCGTGMPISQSLIEDEFTVYGVDASPTLLAEFDRQFPHMHSVCEPVETSTFFARPFEGVVAIGLVFLLPPSEQRSLLSRVASVLEDGGHFLFTSPCQVCEWTDVLTGRQSRSLGIDTYTTLLTEAGLTLVGNYTDEHNTFYFHAQNLD